MKYSLAQKDNVNRITGDSLDDFLKGMFATLRERYVRDQRSGRFYDKKELRPLEDTEREMILGKQWTNTTPHGESRRSFKESLSVYDPDDNWINPFLVPFTYDFSQSYNSVIDGQFNARPRLLTEYPKTKTDSDVLEAVDVIFSFLKNRFEDSEEGKRLFNWFLTYLLALATKGQRPPIAPIIQGEKGSGKSLTHRLAQKLVGEDCFCIVGAALFSSNFLPRKIEQCRLVGADDFCIQGRTQKDKSEAIEHVKNLQKDLVIPLECKGSDIRNVLANFSLFFTTNSTDLPPEFVSDRNFIVIPFNNIELDPDSLKPTAPKDVIDILINGRFKNRSLSAVGFAQNFVAKLVDYIQTNNIKKELYLYKIDTMIQADIIDNAVLSDPILAELLDAVDVGKIYSIEELVSLIKNCPALTMSQKEGMTAQRLGKRLRKLVDQGRYLDVLITDQKTKKKGYKFKKILEQEPEQETLERSPDPESICLYEAYRHNCLGVNTDKCAFYEQCKALNKE